MNTVSPFAFQSVAACTTHCIFFMYICFQKVIGIYAGIYECKRLDEAAGGRKRSIGFGEEGRGTIGERNYRFIL